MRGTVWIFSTDYTDYTDSFYTRIQRCSGRLRIHPCNRRNRWTPAACIGAIGVTAPGRSRFGEARSVDPCRVHRCNRRNRWTVSSDTWYTHTPSSHSMQIVSYPKLANANPMTLHSRSQTICTMQFFNYLRGGGGNSPLGLGPEQFRCTGPYPEPHPGGQQLQRI